MLACCVFMDDVGMRMVALSLGVLMCWCMFLHMWMHAHYCVCVY